MTTTWDESLPFNRLADLVQQIDFRRSEAGNEALLREIPESLLRRALETCCDPSHEAPEAYRFLMNAVRAQHWQEPKAGLWLVAVIDNCRERASNFAWDAAVELHRLYEPALWRRIRQLSISREQYQENPLAVLEACHYSPADGVHDYLQGAYLHTVYRTIYTKEETSRIAAIFAATRELYGYAKVQEFVPVAWCLDWCRTQTDFMARFAGQEREMLIESAIVAADVVSDSGNHPLAQQVLQLVELWTPPTGNSRAAIYYALGMNYQKLGQLGAALRALDKGTRVANVDDEELDESLRLEISTLRALLENSPEQIDLSEIMFEEIEGASEVLQALKTVLIRKIQGETIPDEELMQTISALHAWTHREGETQVDSSHVRLNHRLLLIKAILTMQDWRRSPIPLSQLIVEAEALRDVANDNQLLQLDMLQKILTAS